MLIYKAFRKGQNHWSRPLRNEKGFGLIVLVMIFSLGILLALGSSISQSEFSFSRLKIARTKKHDMQSLKYELNFILGSRPACVKNLSAKKITAGNDEAHPVPLSVIQFGNVSGKPIDPLLDLASPQKSLYGRVPVKRLSLMAHASKFGPAGAGTHLALLLVTLGKSGATDESDDKFLQFKHQVEIPVYVTTDAAGNIQSCHSTQYAEKTALGEDQTLEEKLCNDTMSGKTANWPADCISCLNDTSSYYLCLPCKSIGKKYDPSTQKCV